MVNKVKITDIPTGISEEINAIDQNEFALVDSKLVDKAFKIQI